MKTRELQEMSSDELAAALRDLTSRQVHVRDEVRAGKEKNHAQLAQLRRDIARVQTIAREKTLQS